jgi:hypothetical protein
MAGISPSTIAGCRSGSGGDGLRTAGSFAALGDGDAARQARGRRDRAMNRCLTVIPVARVTLEAPVQPREPTARQWGLAVTAAGDAARRGGENPEAVSLVVAVDAKIRDAAGIELTLDSIAVGDVIEWVAESHGELWIAHQLCVTPGPLSDGDAPEPPAPR